MMLMPETKGITNLDKELETLYTPKPGQVKTAPKKKGAATATKRKTAKKPVLGKGKRKRAVARATLLPGGSGRLTFNGIDIKYVRPNELRELILEPINVTNAAKEIANASDISINTYGGGFSGQAQAARTAVAKVLVNASSSPETLKNFYMEYDRNLIIDDTRRVEPKKFKGPKARARFQTSYR